MKQFFPIWTIGLLLGSSTAFAQTHDTSQPVKTGNEWQMPKDVVKRSKTFSDLLANDLALNDMTRKKVFDTYLSNTKTVDEIRLGTATDKAKKDALASNQLDFDQKLKLLFSSAQFEKYKSGRINGKYGLNMPN